MSLFPSKPLYDKFCIEPHGNESALYFGRSNYAHGFRLCNLSDFDKDKEHTIQKIQLALNQRELILFFASKQIFICIAPDGFLRDGICCWRPIIDYKDERGKWMQEDIGCLKNYDDAFNLCIEFCESLLTGK